MFTALRVAVPLYTLTEWKTSFDMVTASKDLPELCPASDIADIRLVYRINKIANISLLRSTLNVVESSTHLIGNDI